MFGGNETSSGNAVRLVAFTVTVFHLYFVGTFLSRPGTAFSVSVLARYYLKVFNDMPFNRQVTRLHHTGRAEHNHLPKSISDSLVTYLSVGNIVGRVSGGLCSFFPKVRDELVLSQSCIVGGIVILVSAFYGEKSADLQIVYSVLIGFTMGNVPFFCFSDANYTVQLHRSFCANSANDRYREIHGSGQADERIRADHSGDGMRNAGRKPNRGQDERGDEVVHTSFCIFCYFESCGWEPVDSVAIGKSLGE